MAVPTADRSARLALLLARTALSDQAAFAELYRLTSSHLYAVALRILRERASAEDILQEAFVSVWNHAGAFDAAKAQPQTWLTSIVRNRCLDELRRRKPDTVTMTRDDDEPEIEFADAGPTPVELLLAGADAHPVRECVDAPRRAIRSRRSRWRSSRACRTASWRSTSRQPLGTVKSWVRRGLERLKAMPRRSAGFVR